ncbi:MAG: PD-(D/E)XK nuclease family protein, partial [Elusimicrobiota bacterium]|nr:PD-(D/E)XK nuclease family protein [Elusimicrobiota bacterium]
MSKILTVPMSDNIIEFTTDYLLDSTDKTAFLSGSKRPALFIKRNLALKKQKAFYPPAFISTDDFIEDADFRQNRRSKISDLEASYELYKILKTINPQLLKNRESFAEFFSWGLEILFFVERLDLENVSAKTLENIKANAEIGFDVPQTINELLKNIFKIRDCFHSELDKKRQTTKGFSFLQVAQMDVQFIDDGFDEIVLFAPFHLCQTELEIFKKLFDHKNLTIILRGNPNDYSLLKKIYTYLKLPLPRTKTSQNPAGNFKVFSAFDAQSQAAAVKNILKDFSPLQMDKTLIAVPDQSMISPLIAEISSINDNFNVASGYPISKSALFDVISSILKAQISRQDNSYYSKDVVKVLTNPLVKNMRFLGNPALTRAIVHGIEQSFDPSSDNILSGLSFIEIKDLYDNEDLLKTISQITAQMGEYTNPQRLKLFVTDIAKTFFGGWENFDSFLSLSNTLLDFVDKTLKLSIVDSYQLNLQSAEVIIETAFQLQQGEVAKEKFPQEHLINVFLEILKDKKIPLAGSPLKGVQILGLLEARNLSFENVFVVGATDSALPNIKKTSPLIPKEAAYSLGIETSKQEYEIRRYYFDGLISGAKNLYIVYPDDEKNERSRFVEKLIWDKQFKEKDLNAVKIKSFFINQPQTGDNRKRRYEKSAEIKKYLSQMTYSYSSIDEYLRCRLKFYFKYVLSLDEASDVGEDVSSMELGTFIHEYLQTIFYAGFNKENLSAGNFIEKSMGVLSEQFSKTLSLKLRDEAFLVEEILKVRIRQFLRAETQRLDSFIKVFACEKTYQAELGKYKLKCRIDRID